MDFLQFEGTFTELIYTKYMILTTTKNITENYLKNNHIDYYNEMMDFIEDDLPLSERIWLFQNGLKNRPICLNCDNEVKFIKFYIGYRKYCSKSCSAKHTHKDDKVKKSRTSKMKSCNYDVDIRREMTIKANKTKKEFSKSKKRNINKKRINTTKKKYGVDNVFESEEIKDRIKKTIIEKYGVDNPLKSEEIKEKIKRTLLEKYGVDHFSKTDIYNEKMKKYFKVFNDDNCIDSIGDGVYRFMCEKGHEFEIKSDNYLSRSKHNNKLCTICYPIGDQKSIKEREIFKFIEENYSSNIIDGYRDGLEIDIYLPELKIGFEFNGLYWHSEEFKDKNYHLDKTKYFMERGIRIIHIWEDDWVIKKDIIKSQIKNIIKSKNIRIFARKCEVSEVSVKESRMFLNNNHIQGFTNSSLKLGLYYNGELVSIMIFDHNEGRKKMDVDEWNLSRFCNKIDTVVIGGASKLLKHFIRNYNPTRIISYADRDWSVGDLYYKLGFINIGYSKPDYKYIIEKKRSHKSKYKKSKLNTSLTESKYMKEKKIKRIYDCGKIKFEMIIK